MPPRVPGDAPPLTAEALVHYAGRWIAWSPNGRRIVAEADAPEDREDRVLALLGEVPERCIVEGIPAADAVLVGGGLGPAGS